MYSSIGESHGSLIEKALSTAKDDFDLLKAFFMGMMVPKLNKNQKTHHPCKATISI